MKNPTLKDYLTKLADSNRIEGGLRIRGAHFGNKTQPLVSVITVVRNGEKSLRQTIQSVLNQTYSNIEYIIIDGCSTDKTLEIIKSFDDRIAYWLSEPDKGIYDAMNKGIASSSGEWIHLLNADDRYDTNLVLEKAVNTLDKSKTNYFTLALEFADGKQKLQKFDYQAWKLYILPRLPHPALIVAKRQYEEIGLYNTYWRVAADCDLILRLLKRYPAKFTDVVFVVMSQDGFSSRNIQLSFQEYRDITIKNRFPVMLAWIIYYLKLLRWKFKKSKLRTQA